MVSVGFMAISETVSNPMAMAISPSDALAASILGYLWLGATYVFGMIWTTLALIDRWRGPHGDGEINFIAVVAAFLLAFPWPVVLFAMAVV